MQYYTQQILSKPLQKPLLGINTSSMRHEAYFHNSRPWMPTMRNRLLWRNQLLLTLICRSSCQHLLYEAYFHNDIQIRAFTSFLHNQIIWQDDFMDAKHNEDNRLLWIRPEPQNATTFVTEYYQILKKPGMIEHVQKLQSTVLQDCQHFIRSTEIAALQANNLFWQQSTEKRQEHNPFSPTNLEIAISRVPNYI
jgi:hypothetical protein